MLQFPGGCATLNLSFCIEFTSFLFFTSNEVLDQKKEQG